MLNMRKIGAEKVNSMFGTNIQVEFSSSWEDNQIEVDAIQEQITGEVSGQPENAEELEKEVIFNENPETVD